jgi:putative flippase GtrA
LKPIDRAGLVRIATFGGIGLVSFGLDLVVVGGLKALGLSPLLGRIAAFGVGLVTTWLLNRWLTFKTTSPPTVQEFGAFAAANAVGIGINYIIYAAAFGLGAHWILAMVLGTGLGAVWNFLAYQKVLRR